MTESKAKSHGGARCRAGRKPKPNALKTVGVRVLPEVAKRIKEKGGSEFLRKLIESSVTPELPTIKRKIEGLDALSKTSFMMLANGNRLTVPMVEMTVPCGFPSPALDYSHEEVDLTELLIKNPLATYFVRAKGDSMVDAGIYEGDILVIDRSVEAHNGDIVLAYIDGEFTIKRLRIKEGLPELHPENEATDYPVIQPGPYDDFGIEGVVMWNLRKQH